MKPRLGVFKLSCCSGCEAQLFYFGHQVVEVLTNVDIIHCNMVQSHKTPDGPFDLAIIEGAVSEPGQIKELEHLRDVSTLVFAIGSCAINGGIPALVRHQSGMVAQKRVYQDISKLDSIRPEPINAYIEIDGSIPGCPADEGSIVEVLSSALLGKMPEVDRYCVCVECKLAGNICLLTTEDAPCMGPVTRAGCKALCPSNNRPCYSCFGPMEDANAKAYALELGNRGLNPDEVHRLFTQFGSASISFLIGAEKYE